MYADITSPSTQDLIISDYALLNEKKNDDDRPAIQTMKNHDEIPEIHRTIVQ